MNLYCAVIWNKYGTVKNVWKTLSDDVFPHCTSLRNMSDNIALMKPSSSSPLDVSECIRRPCAYLKVVIVVKNTLQLGNKVIFSKHFQTNQKYTVNSNIFIEKYTYWNFKNI